MYATGTIPDNMLPGIFVFSAYSPIPATEKTEDSKYRKDVNHFHLCPSPDGKPLHSKDIKEDSKDNHKHQISFRSSLLYLFFGQIGRISKSDKVFLIEPSAKSIKTRYTRNPVRNRETLTTPADLHF